MKTRGTEWAKKCKIMFLYTLGLKEWAAWNWVLSKKSENQVYSHTYHLYDRALLQNAICSKLLDNAHTLKSHYCSKSEGTHMHARKKGRLLSATKHFYILSTERSMRSARHAREKKKTCHLKTGQPIATRKMKLEAQIKNSTDKGLAFCEYLLVTT